MRRLLAFWKKEWLQLRRSPSLVGLLVLCPLVMVGIVPFGLGNKTRLRVAVVDESFSGRGRETVLSLAGRPQVASVVQEHSLTQACRKMDLGRLDAIIAIPRDGGTPTLFTDGSHTLLAGSAVAALGTLPPQADARVHRKFISRGDNTHYSLISMLVLLIAIIGCCLTALSVVGEKEKKTLEYMQTSGMGLPFYVLAKEGFFVLTGLAELAAGLVIARLVFGLEPAAGLAGTFLLGTAFLWTVTALGIGIAAFTRDIVRAVYVLVFLFISMILLSTMFAPLDNLSPFWAATRWINPFYWVTDGMWKSMLIGAPVRMLAVHAGALLAIGAGLSALNIWKLKQNDG